MEKSKIIEYVLNEWAMRSPDGLAGGHDTPENIKVLNDILTEMSGNDVPIDILEMGKRAANKTPDKTKNPDTKVKKKYSKKLSDKTNEDLNDYGDNKKVRPDDVAHVAQALIDYDKNGSFAKLYNTLDLNGAIETYKNANFASVINAIDKRERKGLGRGELVFIFLLKDYVSGGTAEFDLLHAEGGEEIEMKELTGKSKKKILKVSSATLKGFTTSKFKRAVDELAITLGKNESLGDFLTKVLTGTKEGSSEPLYPGTETISVSDNQKKALDNFINERRTTEMPASLFNALAIIGDKLKNSTANTPKDAIPIGRAVVSIGNQKKEFRIDNPTDAKRDMENAITSLPQSSNLNLKVSLGAEKTDAETEQETKNLEYFEKAYTIETISKEIGELIDETYTGILVIDKRGGNNAEYIPADSYLKFLGITLNGIKLEAKPSERGISSSGEKDADTSTD